MKDSLRVKVVIIGDMGVGKSSLMSRVCYGKFSSDYKPTIQIDYGVKKVESNKYYDIILNIFDVSGHQEYIDKRGKYYKDADCVLLMYDCCMVSSIDNVGNWIREAKSYQDNSNVVYFVVENKNEDEDRRCVSREEGRVLARLVEGEFISVSCKDNIGLDSLLGMIQSHVLNKRLVLDKGIQIRSEIHERE